MKSSYRPRRKIYKKRTGGFKKAVTQIAKKTLMRNSENKIGVHTFSGTNFGTSGLLLTSNGANGLFNGIVQGTSSAGRIGDKIHVRGVKFRVPIEIDPTIVTARRENLTWRVILATNKQDQLTSGDFPSFTGTTDPEKLTILSDRYHASSSTRWTKMFTPYLKFNRVARFSGVQCIGKNLYMWIIPSTLPTGATTTTGYAVSGSVEIYFKDV